MTRHFRMYFITNENLIVRREWVRDQFQSTSEELPIVE